MPDLYFREQPRQAIRHKDRWRVTVRTDDPMGLWKEMQRREDQFRGELLVRYMRLPQWRVKDLTFGINRDRLTILMDVESSTIPVVRQRFSIFKAWKEEGYETTDPLPEMATDLGRYLEALGVDPRGCETDVLY